ncbi:MAG: secondary thiamine-phosphate synthase enzyme YjbQ [Spirochaetia bacterium]|nr:secondary thiamine-phosphate synthase enzyme YjbQ [Spirochaetia bacterium]
MQRIITVETNEREELVDITSRINSVFNENAVSQGILTVYVQGATAGIMIQENWDDSVQMDVIALLRKLIPQGVWIHDYQDNNGDAHLKAGLVGPDVTIPVIDGELGLSTWQNIFLCEFDGPRRERRVVLTLLKDE